MKNILYKYSIGILFAAGMSGCSDFLKETSQNEVRPETTEHLRQLMLTEAYSTGTSFLRFIDLLTDDVSSNANSEKTDRLTAGEPAFTWQEDMLDNLSGVKPFELYYDYISGCNIILDKVDGVTGSPEEKSNLKGQALALRAYYYFMLVNLYGQPYNAAGIDEETSPGVPLILSSGVKDEYPARQSIAQCYRQIESDLLAAVPLLDQYGRNNEKYRVTDLFAYMLLSRMYLYQGNWDKSIEYADKVLARNPNLLKLSNITIPDAMKTDLPAANVYELSSPENIWCYVAGDTEYNYYFKSITSTTIAPFEVSAELTALYDSRMSDATNKRDLRPLFFYQRNQEAPGVMKLFYGFRGSANTKLIKGMRVSEAYLNRAEANIRKFIAGGGNSFRTAALSDLNHLRESRYDTRNVAYANVDIADGQQLLQFCMDERRRELAYEDHRWFDLRRYGMPQIKHMFSSDAAVPQIEYTLEKNSKRYVLRFSQNALTNNPALVQNP